MTCELSSLAQSSPDDRAHTFMSTLVVVGVRQMSTFRATAPTGGEGAGRKREPLHYGQKRR